MLCCGERDVSEGKIGVGGEEVVFGYAKIVGSKVTSPEGLDGVTLLLQTSFRVSFPS